VSDRAGVSVSNSNRCVLINGNAWKVTPKINKLCHWPIAELMNESESVAKSLGSRD